MGRQRICVIEDEEDIAELIRFTLEQARFETLILHNGLQALEKIKAFKPDLILLDLMLPDADGLDICKSLKKDTQLSSIPVIMLTAKGTEMDRIVGFELGADDYIVKPFSTRELVLRIKAILSRLSATFDTSPPDVIRQGIILMDVSRHKVQVDGKDIELTATEFNLLHEFMTNIGRVRTRDVLLDRVWGYSFDGYARTVDTHIRRLRQKLGPAMDYIETIRGVGYRFNVA
ncbi:MAG: response regulator transcription factor [Deltaproteobacteria bacterium]|nr:response regulator transcription factor [Deltaproteobacteria bacterium]